MTIEKIINRLDYLMRKEHAKNAMLSDGFPLDDETLENERTLGEAIALLKTHPDAKSNEPLTLDELRKMKGAPTWLQSKENKDFGIWVIVSEVDSDLGFVSFNNSVLINLIENGDKLVLYRRPPKED